MAPACTSLHARPVTAWDDGPGMKEFPHGVTSLYLSPDQGPRDHSAEDLLVAASLPAVSLGLAAFYGLLVLAHGLALPAAVAPIMQVIAATSAVACLALGLLARAGRVPVVAAPWAGVVLGLIVLVNSGIHMVLSGDPRQSVNLALAMVGFGMFFQRNLLFAGMAALAVASWIAAGVALGSAMDWVHWGFSIATALLLAVLIRIAWTRLLRSSLRNQVRAAAAERVSAAQTDLYERVIAAMGEGLVVRARDGRLLVSNDAATRLLGMPPPEHVPQADNYLSIRDRDGEDLHDEQPIMRALRTGEPQLDITVGISRPDGERRWLAVNAYPMAEDGEMRGVITTFADITARKTAEDRLRDALDQREQALEESERARIRAAAIIDATSEAMILTSDSEVLAANPRMAELMGTPLDDLIGLPRERLREILARVFGTDFDRMRSFVAESDATGVPAPRNFHQVWPRGRDLQIYSRRLLDADGDLVGNLRVFRDITEELRVDRVKTEVISAISHELRTPLTSIKGYADLLLDETAAGLPEQQKREILGVIQTNADRLAAIVNSVLNLTRIEEGRLDLTLEPVAISTIVNDALHAQRTPLTEAGHAVVTDVPQDLPEVLADRRALFEVLVNLLTNAIKYTPPGGTLTIRASQVASPVPMIQLLVSDTGIGIPARDLPRVFTRFFRASNTDSRKTPGTGLGLVITRSLVELMGGAITVTSQEGEGTTFRFTVPIATDEQRQAFLDARGGGWAGWQHPAG